MLIYKLKIDYKLTYVELYKNKYTCVLKKKEQKILKSNSK